MKQITVISGKGGTGKTSITGSFAALSGGAVLADCDVDAADLGLLLGPTVKETHDFRASKKAIIHKSRCSRCGTCVEVCRSEAINDFVVDRFSCEGCGVCYYACPEEAITMEEVLSGRWFLSDTPYGSLVHARLEPGEENSGKLVTIVRNKARQIAEDESKEYLIIDGPPGIGCPVIASLAGVSSALVVTEPTLSGIHDMDRVLGVCEHFGVPALVCINRYDISEENCRAIEKQCDKRGVRVATRIPYDPVVTEAMVRRLPVVEYSNGEVSERIRALWEQVQEAGESK